MNKYGAFVTLVSLALFSDAQPMNQARSNGDDCCNVLINGECTTEPFSNVVESALDGTVITLNGEVFVSSPINVSSSITIDNGNCGNISTVIVDMMGTGKAENVAALKTTRDDLSITLMGLKFTRANTSNDTFGTALWADHKIDLDIRECLFHNLRSPINGASSIYVKSPSNVLVIDEMTNFTSNSVDDDGCFPPVCNPPNQGLPEICPERCWGGGGSVWINSCFGSSTVSIFGNFRNNTHEFGHGMGGAIFMDWVECSVVISGEYEGNNAADGGAIHMESVQDKGVVSIGGKYIDNKSVNSGWGARGAAVRIRTSVMGSSITQQGTYINNTVEGRGAVSAYNSIHGAIDVNVDATNNTAEHGTVISVWKEFGGNLTFHKDCSFSGNTANDDTNVMSFLQMEWYMNETEFIAKTNFGSNDYLLN
eukprot:CFRG3541T1